MALPEDAAASAAAQTPPSEACGAEQAPAQTPAPLPAGEAPDEAAPVASAAQVQHVGTWLAAVRGPCAGALWGSLAPGPTGLPDAGAAGRPDAFGDGRGAGAALRRGRAAAMPPSAPLLLRTPQAPASWVRWRLSQFAQQQRGRPGSWPWLGATSDEQGRRPRTAGACGVLHRQPPAALPRQTHGARAGACRTSARCRAAAITTSTTRRAAPVAHQRARALAPTDWLLPLARRLREALGPDQPLLLCFDRAGAPPEQMAALRTEGVEFVTYERKAPPDAALQRLWPAPACARRPCGCAKPRAKTCARAAAACGASASCSPTANRSTCSPSRRSLPCGCSRSWWAAGARRTASVRRGALGSGPARRPPRRAVPGQGPDPQPGATPTRGRAPPVAGARAGPPDARVPWAFGPRRADPGKGPAGGARCWSSSRAAPQRPHPCPRGPDRAARRAGPSYRGVQARPGHHPHRLRQRRVRAGRVPCPRLPRAPPRPRRP